jgi:hypothetical protein
MAFALNVRIGRDNHALLSNWRRSRQWHGAPPSSRLGNDLDGIGMHKHHCVDNFMISAFTSLHVTTNNLRCSNKRY